MSQQNDDTAGAPGDDGARIAAAMAALGDVGVPDAEPAQAAPAPVETPAASPSPEPQTPDPTPQEAAAPEGQLAEVIRAQRADRQARAVKEREAADLRAQLEDANTRLAKVSKVDMVSDPVGYAQAKGLSEQEMVLVAQAMLYHLVPEKAPPDLRYKMLEAKSAREAKAREAEREAQLYAQANQEQAQQIKQYTAALGVAVQTWETGTHPFTASQAWFGGNHDEYAESLVHTARNLAESAEARGEVADLSPKAVAAALEQDISSRMARFRTPAAAPSQPSEKVVPAKPAPGGKQPAVMSTRGQGGGPVPPAETEEERMKRALAVLDVR